MAISTVPMTKKPTSLLDLIIYESENGAKNGSSNASKPRQVPARRPAAGVILCGNLTVDFRRQRALRDGEPVELTPTEFKLLELLTPYAGRPLPHEFNMAELWGPGYEDEIEHIQGSVWSLHRKLNDNLPLRRLLWSLRRTMNDNLGLQRHLRIHGNSA